MRVVKVANYEEMSQKAAECIIRQVKEKPDSVLGLATGGTVIGTYQLLAKDHQKNGTSYRQILTVNLDEYIGISPEHEQSYHFYMKKRLFDHVQIPPENTYLPDGQAEDLEEECKRYDERIESLGGIDLQLLGIGVNGHIGFNEPGTPFDSKTHIVELSESTRKANARFFNTLEEVPKKAITMGIETIMKSKKILLLASGLKKAPIIRKLFQEGITEEIPASVLKKHENVVLIADEEALSLVDPVWVETEVEF
ncbi:MULTISPECIES: glucosamine-6-phosphate deaminase [Bacillus]|uniref:glucosamine-6-phosphate deaminase n=1 Tax=Bacillus TaxID=1386 RepID=UPI00065E7A35|nr:glucosamine-6-phosphate deaminase [Bacillus smithii]AKP45881.1 Glucosamine-6-phosphate deaminase [Bacillus smithii]MED4882660.1 glucosamine-6-phosphate deaminase [Bacillus smithii]MED4926441.1 glucosamine-6-phosphate deaminase [Bacillus smithii]